MERYKLGKSELEVSTVGLGCMGLSEFYDTNTDQPRARELIARAVDLGINFFDTADMYGPHTNERLLGEVLKPFGDRIVVATKFGVIRGEDRSFLGVSGTPEYVRRCCDASLLRLGRDTIDLYYQHRVDPNTPIEETVGAMAELVTAGKVRYLGLSEASPATLRRAHSVHPITALQTEYSLWSREPEAELLGVCRELGIGFVAYSPLGRGFLTGRFRSTGDISAADFRRTLPRFSEENLAKNQRLLQQIDVVADKHAATPAQVALAWLLHQGRERHDIHPIPGTTRVSRLEENVGATTLKLSEAEVRDLSEALPLGAAAGARYPESSMALLDG
ncbi:MAG TPA: aldo/keto reductase [Polyangiaceae bacterium]|nr:aldo/keto reductase [Polyangiaceae bacterium]